MNDMCSIVIRCYNEEQQIGRLLTGIRQQTIPNAEVIVVDSGSNDANVAIASRFSVKILTVRSEEFSFGRSLNIGRQAASSDFIVIASAHVYPVYQDWLENLLAPFEEPEVALVYGKQRGNETTQFAEYRVFAQWFPDEANGRQKHRFCNNANAAIRRDLWQKLPYYDEELTGLEDLDWANRAIALGYHLSYRPHAEVIHVHNETPIQTYNRYRREAIAFKRIFPQERFVPWDLLRLWTANTKSDFWHASREGVLLREWWSIARFRLMQFWGTYRGYRQHVPVSSQLRRTFYYPNHQRASRLARPGNRAGVHIQCDRTREESPG